MNTEFKASFARDLKNIQSEDLLKRVKKTIEQVEQAQTLQDFPNLIKLKGARSYYRVRIGEYRIGMIPERGTVTSCDVWIEKKSTNTSDS